MHSLFLYIPALYLKKIEVLITNDIHGLQNIEKMGLFVLFFHGEEYKRTQETIAWIISTMRDEIGIIASETMENEIGIIASETMENEIGIYASEKIQKKHEIISLANELNKNK